MKVCLCKISTKNIVCFSLCLGEKNCYTSYEISKHLGLNVNTYNRILIDQIIKHKIYSVNKEAQIVSLMNDLSFSLNKVNPDTYIERFKNVFARELMLLSLGGEWFVKNWNKYDF